MTRTILVPLDGSSQSELALAHAANLARGMRATLHLVRVHAPVLPFPTTEVTLTFPDPLLDGKVRDATKLWLISAAADVEARFGLRVTTDVPTGTPAEEIVRAATARNADLIVCTTHGHGGWAPQWLGSVTDALIRNAPCPVLALTEQAATGAPQVRNILVTLDGSEAATAILPHVRDLAHALGARIHLFRVVAPPWVGNSLGAYETDQVDRFGIDHEADRAKVELDRAAQDLVAAGVAATALVQVAAHPTRAILGRIAELHPDMVAIATHGRGLSRLFMGSVADKVLRAGGTPTLCVRAPRPEHAEPDVGMFATPFANPAA